MIIATHGILATTNKIVTNGLLLHLDAGNSSSYIGSGTLWSDLSGNNAPSTLINGVGYSSSNGGYLTLDGVNDYINGTNNSLYNFTDNTKDLPFTMTGWLYKSTNSTFYIVNKGDDGGASQEAYAISIDSSNKIDVRLYDFTGSKQIYKISDNAININQWYNYAVTYTGSSGNNPTAYNDINIYINGVLQSASTSGNFGGYSIMRILNSLTSLWIGSFGSTGLYSYTQSNGRISQQMIYNRVLTQSEITQNFNALKTRYGL
jgi:hypothetical protein